jgi:hypothetical protein
MRRPKNQITGGEVYLSGLICIRTGGHSDFRHKVLLRQHSGGPGGSAHVLVRCAGHNMVAAYEAGYF